MADGGSRPEDSGPEPSLIRSGCPAREILDVLAEKWVLPMLYTLKDGPARTGELRRKIEGVSDRMLIKTLRRLEEFGLVERRSYAEVPPRVDYRLTALGASLAERVRALDDWVEAHARIIATARSAAR